MKNEFMAGKRTMDELCWIESQDCWICDRWTYFIPIITIKEIMGCMDDEPDRKLKEELNKLTPAQERTFNNLISTQQAEFDKLEYDVPYILGNLTHSQFVRMDLMIDYFKEIDPEFPSVPPLPTRKARENYLHTHYRCSWSRVLKNALRGNAAYYK